MFAPHHTTTNATSAWAQICHSIATHASANSRQLRRAMDFGSLWIFLMNGCRAINRHDGQAITSAPYSPKSMHLRHKLGPHTLAAHMCGRGEKQRCENRKEVMVWGEGHTSGAAARRGCGAEHTATDVCRVCGRLTAPHHLHTHTFSRRPPPFS